MRFGRKVVLAVIAAAGMVAWHAGTASADPFVCSGSDCTFTGAGGSSEAGAVALAPLPAGDSYDAIDPSLGADEFYEFTFGGGDLNVTFDPGAPDVTGGTSLDLVMYDAAGTVVDTPVSINSVAGTLTISTPVPLALTNLDPGTYVFGLQDNLTEGTATLAFSAPVDPLPAPVPEPASLALFGGGLIAVGIWRWRRRRSD